MATVLIDKKELGEVNDVKTLFSKLAQKYSGKWVAILENGEVISTEKPEDLYKLAEEKKSKVGLVFQASIEGQQFFL